MIIIIIIIIMIIIIDIIIIIIMFDPMNSACMLSHNILDIPWRGVDKDVTTLRLNNWMSSWTANSLGPIYVLVN